MGETRHVQRRPGIADDYKPQDAQIIPQSELELDAIRSRDPELKRRFAASSDHLISRKPHVENVLGNALTTVHLQLDLLAKKAEDFYKAGELLPYDLERRIHKLTETAARLTREIRAQEEHERIEEITEDEFRLAGEVLFNREEDDE